MKIEAFSRLFPTFPEKTQNYSNFPDPDPIRYLKIIFLTPDLTSLSGYEIKLSLYLL